MDMYLHDGASSFRFVLLGSLESTAARELDRAWITVSSIVEGRGVVVDVTDLTGLDREGMIVLSRMRDSGCQLLARREPCVPGVASLVTVTEAKVASSGHLARWMERLVPRWPAFLVLALCAFLARTTSCGPGDPAERPFGLNRPAASTEQIIAGATRSVCLIQGSYVFREIESGAILRRSGWYLDGDESVVENAFTGTGFLASTRGDIITNRHVAQPWRVDSEALKIAAAGYLPEMKSLRAYFPGRRTTYRLKPIRLSAKADVAILRAEPVERLPPPLALDNCARVAPGGRVLLVGFPGGLGPVLGRRSQALPSGIPEFLNVADPQVAGLLAAQQSLDPFVSFGFVSNVDEQVVTLAVPASDGSSGSPVINERGAVIGVLAASLVRVDGGSIAVPAQAALELMRQRYGD